MGDSRRRPVFTVSFELLGSDGQDYACRVLKLGGLTCGDDADGVCTRSRRRRRRSTAATPAIPTVPSTTASFGCRQDQACNDEQQADADASPQHQDQSGQDKSKGHRQVAGCNAVLGSCTRGSTDCDLSVDALAR